MTPVDRRKFLQIAGTASAAAAVGLPIAGSMSWTEANALRFQAVTGLPKAPLPAYASYVITGGVDLAARTGSVTTAVYAGAPGAMSEIQFPGLTRKIRITAVTTSGGILRINGRVSGAAALRPGESRNVGFLIDREAGTVRANFLGDEVMLQLDQTLSLPTSPG
jgi:hypothetical protein